MDKNLLMYEIKKNGFSVESFCVALGISKSAFYRKTNGVSQFTLQEIEKTIDILKLKSPMPIFFNAQVS